MLHCLCCSIQSLSWLKLWNSRVKSYCKHSSEAQCRTSINKLNKLSYIPSLGLNMMQSECSVLRSSESYERDWIHFEIFTLQNIYWIMIPSHFKCFSQPHYLCSSHVFRLKKGFFKGGKLILQLLLYLNIYG